MLFMKDKTMKRFFLFALTVLAVGVLRADEPTLKPFVIDWSSDARPAVDVSFLLDAPAGKDGFVRIAGGHLVRPDGRRFRIWGINATGKEGMPEKADAPKIARQLAARGINCIRFHFLDGTWAGLIDTHRQDTQTFLPQMLDQLDYFIAQLKAVGVYSDLNLNVGRRFKPGDGVPDCKYLGLAKAVTYFDPKIIALEKQYAKQLLTHLNPYTHNEYRNEPAVAMVEMLNENSVVESWISDRLQGMSDKPGHSTGDQTWADIPASYERELTDLYNRWLAQKLSPEALAALRKEAGVATAETVPRLHPKEFAKASPERFRTEASFYMDIERRFFADMQRYLKDELHVQSLLLGTSDHNHGRSGYPLLSSTAMLDIVDGHVYWQHPNIKKDPKGKHVGFTVLNTPMVNDPTHSTVVQLSRSAVAGKPYVVSEVNHPFPHEYACEGIPILAAYAALHDWDGLFWYTLGHGDIISRHTRNMAYFDIGADPMKMSQMVAGSLLFLRSDVQPAKKTVARSYSADQVRDSLRSTWSDGPYFTAGFPLSLPLIHATRIESLNGRPTENNWPHAEGNRFVSDTGELIWDGAAAKQGQVAVITDRSQSLIGFCSRSESKNLAIDVEPKFCAVTLTSIDAQPIAKAKRLLLTATARVGNTEMKWTADRKSLSSWGKPPACIEPVRGRVTLRGIENASKVVVQPLDGAGHALGNAITAAKTTDGWQWNLGDAATTWYLLSVERGG
jgi:hypothetical protein